MSTRAARRAERRKQKGRAGAQSRSLPWFTALVVAVVVVFAFLLLRSLGAFESTNVPSGPAINPAQVQANLGQKQESMGNGHLQPGQRFSAYNTVPPTSGPHDPVPLGYGVYGTQQPDEKIVHSLEHGAVLIAYNGISDDDLAKLKAIRSRYPKDKFNEVKIIIEPYPRLEQGTIALAAWGYLDKMSTYDERRIIGFLAAHLDQGPEDAP